MSTGFKKLKEELENDFYVYDCPWDWRQPCQQAAATLKKVIDDALSVSTSGKVHIVAHSMGGLVARAYIQGSSYDNDVWRLALVGTPHLGSCNPYYIWEGGDPKLIDDILDTVWTGYTSFINMYSNTVQNLWEETYGKKGWRNGNWEAIRSFVRLVVPSLKQLMFTEDFLKNGSSVWDVDTLGNENKWLKDLNAGQNGYVAPGTRMSAADNGKVCVQLFVGDKSDSTVRWVKTKDPSSLWFTSNGYDRTFRDNLSRRTDLLK